MSDHSVIPTSDQAVTTTSDHKGKAPRKPKPKPADQAKGKRSLNLSIDQETYQRLALHALDEDTTISEIVSALARTHLRRVHLTRTTTRPTDPKE